MPLTDTGIRKAKPALKAARLFDQRGLYLEVAPNGGKWWRLNIALAARKNGYPSAFTLMLG